MNNIYKEMIQVIKVKANDLKKASIIFANAMYNDPLHSHFFPNENSRYKKLVQLFMFKLKLDFKNLYTTSDSLEGFVIWKDSKERRLKFSFIDLIKGGLMTIIVGLSPILKMVRYQKWITRLHKLYLKDPYCCLDLLVISPPFQGKGFSTTLIKPKLLHLSSNNEVAFLETQNAQNVDIYEHYGFKLIYQEKLINTKITSYGMIKI
ncbi:MAG: GNAT family N-acetyltransferase [Firmicutes bacterium]|nr:GNAT family N-acetyltransferase [Bacillota bacterium]